MFPRIVLVNWLLVEKKQKKDATVRITPQAPWEFVSLCKFFCCFDGEGIVCSDPEVMYFGKGLLVLNPSAIHTSPKFTHVGCILKTTSS